MKILLMTAALTIAVAATPVLAQATGGAGSATAGGTASPGNAGAGVTADYATGKSSATIPNGPGQQPNAPGAMPNQNRASPAANQNGTRGDTESGSNTAQPPVNR